MDLIIQSKIRRNILLNILTQDSILYKLLKEDGFRMIKVDCSYKLRHAQFVTEKVFIGNAYVILKFKYVTVYVTNAISTDKLAKHLKLEDYRILDTVLEDKTPTRYKAFIKTLDGYYEDIDHKFILRKHPNLIEYTDNELLIGYTQTSSYICIMDDIIKYSNSDDLDNYILYTFNNPNTKLIDQEWVYETSDIQSDNFVAN